MSACLLVLSLLVTGCGSVTAPPTGAPSREPVASAVASRTPAASRPSEATPSVPTPSPTETSGTSAPTPNVPVAPTPVEPSLLPGAADGCSGSDQNRAFFEQVAAAVSWDVYCAVLPVGWFVESGSYRLANTGRLEITYAGPGGAHLALSQGAFCADTSGCVPGGSQRGEAPFADRTGSVIALDGGGTAMVVDRGAVPSWLMVATGIGESQALDIAAALVVVEG